MVAGHTGWLHMAQFLCLCITEGICWAAVSVCNTGARSNMRHLALALFQCMHLVHRKCTSRCYYQLGAMNRHTVSETDKRRQQLFGTQECDAGAEYSSEESN